MTTSFSHLFTILQKVNLKKNKKIYLEKKRATFASDRSKFIMALKKKPERRNQMSIHWLARGHYVRFWEMDSQQFRRQNLVIVT